MSTLVSRTFPSLRIYIDRIPTRSLDPRRRIMFETMTATFTFIPHADRNISQRERELLHSKAKSHAALRSHKLAQMRKKDPASLCSSRISTVASPSKQSQTYQEVLPPPNRSADWCFGSMGAACKISAFDADALRYFGNSNCNSKNVQVWMGPLVRETIQHAVHQTLCLQSLVTATAYLMAEEFSRGKYLMHMGHKYNARAMRDLQALLKRPSATTFSDMYFSVAHLCIASLRIGDMDASVAHLKFLVASSGKLDPTNVLHLILQGTVSL